MLYMATALAGQETLPMTVNEELICSRPIRCKPLGLYRDTVSVADTH